MRKISKALWFTIAAVFLVETWLWDQFVSFWRWLAEKLPVVALKAALERGIARLSPPMVLPVFLLPVIVIFPFKIGALWLIAHGKVILGGLAFLGAKLVSVAIAAFLFDLTRAKLMSMEWFARLYVMVMRWRDWAHGLVDPYKQKIREAMAPYKAKLHEALLALGLGKGSFVKKIAVLRERARRMRKSA